MLLDTAMQKMLQDAQDLVDYSRGLKGSIDAVKADLSKTFAMTFYVRSGAKSTPQPRIKTLKADLSRTAPSSQSRTGVRVQERSGS